MNLPLHCIPAEAKVIVDWMDGQQIVATWGEFVDANGDDAEEIEALAEQIKNVGVAKGGGGAAPAYTVTRDDAMGRMMRKMAKRAPLALGATIRHGARRLQLRTIRQIAERLYGFGRAPQIITTHALLAKARAAYAGERSRGRAGHWSHDFNRMLAVAEIIVELKRRIVAAGGLKIEEAA